MDLVEYIMCYEIEGLIMSSDNRKTYIIYYTIYDKYDICVYVSPPRHAGTRARPRGRATWPCVPHRIHVGPRVKFPIFALFELV